MLALEKCTAGARYHGVAVEGIPYLTLPYHLVIADLIRKQLSVPARSCIIGWEFEYISLNSQI